MRKIIIQTSKELQTSIKKTEGYREERKKRSVKSWKNVETESKPGKSYTEKYIGTFGEKEEEEDMA